LRESAKRTSFFQHGPLDRCAARGNVRAHSSLAQLAEQAAVNRRVLGSSPRAGATCSKKQTGTTRCFTEAPEEKSEGASSFRRRRCAMRAHRQLRGHGREENNKECRAGVEAWAGGVGGHSLALAGRVRGVAFNSGPSLAERHGAGSVHHRGAVRERRMGAQVGEWHARSRWSRATGRGFGQRRARGPALRVGRRTVERRRDHGRQVAPSRLACHPLLVLRAVKLQRCVLSPAPSRRPRPPERRRRSGREEWRPAASALKDLVVVGPGMRLGLRVWKRPCPSVERGRHHQSFRTCCESRASRRWPGHGR
jgi:hypothetical protein